MVLCPRISLDFFQACSSHNHLADKGMSQIIKPEILNARLDQSCREGFLDIL